jgi:hypothetical protein
MMLDTLAVKLPFDRELEQRGWMLIVLSLINNMMIMVAYCFDSNGYYIEGSVEEGGRPEDEYILYLEDKSGMEILAWYAKQSERLAEDIKAGKTHPTIRCDVTKRQVVDYLGI